MAAEPYLISNPRNSEQVLSVARPLPQGGTKTVATLPPGETYRADSPVLIVTSRPVPARLLIDQSGAVRPDPKRTGPRLAKLSAR